MLKTAIQRRFGPAISGVIKLDRCGRAGELLPTRVVSTPNSLSPRVGHLGRSHGTHLNRALEEITYQALVDTGSTIALVHPGILPNSSRSLPQGWSPTLQCITTVTSDSAKMIGTRSLRLRVSGQQRRHQFWLANIQDPCIISLNLLGKWGSVVDMSRATLSLGTETMVLHEYSDCDTPTQGSIPPVRTVSAERITPPRPPVSADPPLTTQSQTMDIKGAIDHLFKRNCQDLNREQQQQLKDLLQTLSDVFAARDEDCTHTNLVLHNIDTPPHPPPPTAPSPGQAGRCPAEGRRDASGRYHRALKQSLGSLGSPGM